MVAWARCAAEKASLTQMSPSFASSATKAGSFFSSSLWKRVFSRHRMSPSCIAPTALAAASPMQSSAKATGFLITCASAAATGFSDSLGSRPFGRPKCASRMTLPPLPEISLMVGAIALQPRGVGDAAIFHGHVEVDAQQHALALYVDVIEGAE